MTKRTMLFSLSIWKAYIGLALVDDAPNYLIRRLGPGRIGLDVWKFTLYLEWY